MRRSFVFACACCVAITLPSAWASSSVGATGAQFDAVEEELSTTYDYIVVGAGVAGGVVAARLSQESPASVLVLETGTDESENPLLQPSYFFKDSKFTHLYRHFFSQEGENMNNRRLYHMNSKALGGGSAINAMVWTRGDPRDWDLWSEKTGIPGWTFGDVLPYYQTMETYERAVDGDLRGRDGPIHVAYYDPNPITLQAVNTAASTFKLPVVADLNSFVHEGAAILQRNVRGNRPITAERQSSWRALLEPASKTQKNLKVQTRATVTKIIIDEKHMKATGVEALIDGVQMQITARKEVIICAGAHNSPKILLLSGVGNATELAEVGIPALVDLPGVGHHMMDHINPGSLIFYGPSRTDYDGNLVGAYGRTGVVPHEATPDVEFGYIMGPAAEKQEHWPYVPSIHMFYCLMLNVDASGHVKLLSKDPLADPLIESGYFKNNVDQKRVVQVFRKLFAWADKMNKVLPLTQSSAGPYPLRISPASSDADIINEVRNTADTHWHVSGTCKMGNDADNLAVVDGQFRVRGVKQLRVVDASAMPVVPNGHPMATIMMMAERAVEWIVADNSE